MCKNKFKNPSLVFIFSWKILIILAGGKVFRLVHCSFEFNGSFVFILMKKYLMMLFLVLVLFNKSVFQVSITYVNIDEFSSSESSISVSSVVSFAVKSSWGKKRYFG